MTCSLCDGSGYLSRQPAFGPCTCVTPETIAELNGDVSALTADRDSLLTERDEGLAVLAAAGDALAIYLVSLGLSAHPVTLADPNLERLVDLLGE